MEQFRLNFDSSSHCDVVIGAGILDRIEEFWKPACRDAVIIGDSNTVGLFGKRIEEEIAPLVGKLRTFEFPPGEASKTRHMKEILEDRMLEEGFGRDTCIIGLGGGVTLDLAGFVAATYMRGVKHINIPTSFLAQVDASIGGKTGINTDKGKNLIGAFKQPEAIIADVETLSSLSPFEWINGVAEFVKIAFAADADFFGMIRSHGRCLMQHGQIDPQGLRRCMELKAKVVQEDELETGRRVILNFGHTVGHTIEQATDYRISHGLAVSAGMALETGIAVKMGIMDSGDRLELIDYLKTLGLPTSPQVSFEQAKEFFKFDKKRKSGEIRMALPSKIGEMAGADQGYTVVVPIDVIESVWKEWALA